MKRKQADNTASVRRWFAFNCAAFMVLLAFTVPSIADDQDAKTKQLVIELFVRPDSEQCKNAQEFLNDLGVRRKGIEVKTYDVTTDKEALARLWKLAKQFGKEKAELPTTYFCNSIKVGFRDAETTGREIENYLTIRAFVRTDCPHCEDAKAFLKQFSQRWPAIKIEYLNVVVDANAHDEFEKLSKTFGKKLVSFPCLQVAGRLVVGFQDNETTGKQIEGFFEDRSVSSPSEGTSPKGSESKEESNSEKQSRRLAPPNLCLIGSLFAANLPVDRRAAWQGTNPDQSLADDDGKKKQLS